MCDSVCDSDTLRIADNSVEDGHFIVIKNREADQSTSEVVARQLVLYHRHPNLSNRLEVL